MALAENQILMKKFKESMLNFRNINTLLKATIHGLFKVRLRRIELENGNYEFR
jgi:hypothetical protein